jgi:hypothetical protein
MPKDMPELQTRLDTLEKELRRAYLIAIVLLIVATGAFFTSRARRNQVVEAEQFILKDGNGETRGGLAITAHGPALEFYDSNKTLRLSLSVADDQANLLFKDARGTGVLVMADTPTSTGVMLYDRDGEPRTQLDVGKEGPRLYLEDRDGFQATVGYTTVNDPAIPAKNSIRKAASVVLSKKDLGVIWRAP